METTPDLAQMNGQPALPVFVEADPNNSYLTPNEVGAVTEAAGCSIADLDEKGQLQLVVWIALRRLGYVTTWEEAGDVGLKPIEPALSDPTATDTSKTSPASASSTG
jgi:hypothetical protein